MDSIKGQTNICIKTWYDVWDSSFWIVLSDFQNSGDISSFYHIESYMN